MKKNLFIAVTGLLMMTFSILSCAKGGDEDAEAPAPTISNITPNALKTGEVITVTGTNLSGASVTISNIIATVTNNSSTSLKATVPPAASVGVQGVVVTTSGGTATEFITITGSDFLPTITSFSPTNIKIGESLTITGTGFASGGTVQIATKVATVTGYTATTITATIPSGIALGAASVRVTTSLGSVVTGGLTIIP